MLSDLSVPGRTTVEWSSRGALVLAALDAIGTVIWYSGVAARRTASTKAPTTAKITNPAQSCRQARSTAAKPAARGTTSPSLGDQILALANGKTQQEIADACKGVRANHVGIALARHKRAGRIEEARWEALCDAIDGANPAFCGLTPEQIAASVLRRNSVVF